MESLKVKFVANSVHGSNDVIVRRNIFQFFAKVFYVRVDCPVVYDTVVIIQLVDELAARIYFSMVGKQPF